MNITFFKKEEEFKKSETLCSNQLVSATPEIYSCICWTVDTFIKCLSVLGGLFLSHTSYRYAKLCELIIVTDVRFSLISSGGIERTTNCRLQREHQSRQETGGT